MPKLDGSRHQSHEQMTRLLQAATGRRTMYAARQFSVKHAKVFNGIYRVFELCLRYLNPIANAIGIVRLEAAVLPIERLTKGLLFDCQMCGQCVLSKTGMACPTNCAKQMRNGPCGGVRKNGGCEVKPEMRCVWLEAGDGGRQIVEGCQKPSFDLKDVLPVLPPIDHTRAGQSSWIRVIGNNPVVEEIRPFSASDVISHPAGHLESVCKSGRHVVTVEIAPPDSSDPSALVKRATKFKDLADAINITDGAGGNCHMSSVAASAILVENKLTPVYQIACRDRNRIAIQGDILGAAALGVQNILCLTGDDVSQGDHPQAKPVFDLDSVSLLRIARGMCDRGEYASGRKLERAPSLFIGATANPFVPPYRERILNLEKKVDAGAQFIQTQFCFDVILLKSFMKDVRDRDIHKRCQMIIGVGTLSSAKALKWMATHVPGIYVPDELISRIASSTDQLAEAKQICIEIIAEIVDIEGVAGVHVMGHKNEDVLAEIITESGIRQSPR